MTKILVSLVSDQTIPNVLFINEHHEIDRYLFISTEKMESKEVSKNIIQASQGPTSENSTVIIVKEDCLNNIGSRLQETTPSGESEYVVNLTGGTKIMAIGAYNFYNKLKSNIYYIPIGKNLYQCLDEGTKAEDRDIEYRIGVRDYLGGYGISIRNPKKIHKTVFSADETKSFFDFYIGLNDESLLFLNNLREKRNVKKVSISSLGDGIKDLLQKSPLKRLHNTDELKKGEIKYLTGEWFEEYVYHLLRKQLRLNDESIALGVQIEQGENVPNEIDIILTLDNRLYVIECKTKIYDATQNKSILNETLYKLSALRKDFGLFAKPYLFTLSGKDDEIKNSHEKRSDLFGITMVGREMFCDAEAIRKLIKAM